VKTSATVALCAFSFEIIKCFENEHKTTELNFSCSFIFLHLKFFVVLILKTPAGGGRHFCMGGIFSKPGFYMKSIWPGPSHAG
jgi:hypothetical protein